MLILINMTGLKKTYFVPYFKRYTVAELGWWSIEAKWLFVQVLLFNKKSGHETIKFMSEKYKEHL